MEESSDETESLIELVVVRVTSLFRIWLYNEHTHFMILTSFDELLGEGVLESDLAPPFVTVSLVLLLRTSIALERGEREMHLNLVTLMAARLSTVWNILWMVEWKKEWRDCLHPKIAPILDSLRYPELAIFGKTPMKLPLAKRSFDLDLDIWLGNRKEPNSQMHVQWFHWLSYLIVIDVNKDKEFISHSCNYITEYKERHRAIHFAVCFN